ncbi:MAG: HD domain-containing protein [Lachnospiraceae bacterium]|nr:HD domain-containing protein [Lachnospiraceae bacterium]
MTTFERLGIKLQEHTPKFRFQDFTDTVRLGLLKLDIDAVVDCADNLVEDLIGGEYSGMLHLVFDYDLCTFTHSRNVTLLSLLAAIELGYPVKDLKTIAVGSLLHDIGKLHVPLDILDKPGRLTRDEFNIIKQHPQFGYEMVEDISSVSLAVKQIILQHHENYDGTGYPKCLDSTHGYRLARLVHICDVYEAMCARRPYKLPMPREDVRNFLIQNSGLMFDPSMVNKFLSAVPAYLIGEELTVCGVSCIVVSCSETDDPIIQYKDMTCKLSELQTTLQVAS